MDAKTASHSHTNGVKNLNYSPVKTTMIHHGHANENADDNGNDMLSSAAEKKNPGRDCGTGGQDNEDFDSPLVQKGKTAAELPLSGSVQEAVTTYDGVLTLLGEFGRYQKWVCFLLCLPSMSGALQVLITVFTLAVPDHRCALPGMDNDTWRIQSPHHAALINASIPLAQTSSSSSPFSSCEQYRRSSSSLLLLDGNASDTAALIGDEKSVTSLGSCDRYVYDDSSYGSSIVTEMNLVCERSLFPSHVQMMVMVGSLLGSQLSGIFADIWGRKIVLMLFIVVHVTSAFALTWVQNFAMLMTLSVPLGMSISGMLCPSFVLSMEFVSPTKRLWPGYGVMGFWSLGMILLAPLAFWLRDWSHLQLATAIIAVPLLSLWWLIPESPRWLMSKNRMEDAEKVVARAARVNGVTLPPGLLQKALGAEKTAHLPFWKTCSNAKLLFRHLVIFFVWFVASLTYYGLSWNVGTLSGNVYVNMALSGLVELVAYALCLALLDRVGRRALCCAQLMLAGVTCTATILPVLYAPPSMQWVTVVLAMAGKLGIAGAFGTIWIFSSELFPTVLRNSSMGASSVCARVGGILAPYIANMAESLDGKSAVAIPLVIFGLSSMVAGLLLFLLPETRHRHLPETIQDAIDMSRKPASTTAAA